MYKFILCKLVQFTTSLYILPLDFLLASESRLILVIYATLQRTAVCCELTLSEYIVFERYHLSAPPSPSGSPSGASGGRGPLPTQVQHEDARSRTSCEGDPSHPPSGAPGEARVQGEVHSPGAEHVGLLCGQSKALNHTYVECTNESCDSWSSAHYKELPAFSMCLLSALIISALPAAVGQQCSV